MVKLATGYEPAVPSNAIEKLVTPQEVSSDQEQTVEGEKLANDLNVGDQPQTTRSNEEVKDSKKRSTEQPQSMLDQIGNKEEKSKSKW